MNVRSVRQDVEPLIDYHPMGPIQEEYDESSTLSRPSPMAYNSPQASPETDLMFNPMDDEFASLETPNQNETQESPFEHEEVST